MLYTSHGMHCHSYFLIARECTGAQVSRARRVARRTNARFELRRKRKSISMSVTATSYLEVICLFYSVQPTYQSYFCLTSYSFWMQIGGNLTERWYSKKKEEDFSSYSRLEHLLRVESVTQQEMEFVPHFIPLPVILCPLATVMILGNVLVMRSLFNLVVNDSSIS